MQYERPRTRARACRSPILAFAILFACTNAICAQKVSEQEIKAAYLYNFAKFVEWPTRAFENNNAPLRLCVFSRDPLEADLRKIVKGKSIANRSVSVVSVRPEDDYRACHILFVGPAQGAQAKQILAALRGASVLTVGDIDEFARSGGIIQFVLNNDRVQFQVNQKAAEQAQLAVSSRLLRVARAVIE